jgi:hypothetical protein
VAIRSFASQAVNGAFTVAALQTLLGARGVFAVRAAPGHSARLTPVLQWAQSLWSAVVTAADREVACAIIAVHPITRLTAVLNSTSQEEVVVVATAAAAAGGTGQGHLPTSCAVGAGKRAQSTA